MVTSGWPAPTRYPVALVSTSVRRWTTAERRARLAQRHCLAPAALASDPVAAARAVVALHATDPSTVYLSACWRTHDRQLAAVQRALYDDRRLIRMLGMRRTLFVAPVELMPVIQAACTDAIAALERRRALQLIEGAGLTGGEDPGRWLAAVERETLEALDDLGEATASQLAERVPHLQGRIRMAEGKAYAGWLGLSTRVLLLLGAEGKIVRSRPRGSWTSSQHRWAPADRWLTQSSLGPALSREAAQAELVRAWLASFGPGTLADLRWWTGLGAREVQRALAALETVEVDLDGTPGFLLREDREPVSADDREPWVALLPALDPTPMGWAMAGRAWFLGPHAPALFDSSGNIGPTVWSDGRIVGGWAQRKSGEVVVRLLEEIGQATSRAITQAAADLQAWLGPTRITPRFRTPLERELSA